MPTLRWCHLGRIEYAAARTLQDRLAAVRATGRCDDLLLLLEHPPVLTVGRNAPLPESVSLPVVRTDRGGKLTYHGPGQLVGYPVVALRAAGKGVRDFVCRLERALCDTARAFGVAARQRDGLPGVWTDDDRKLASIGLGVRRGVTLHGCALNLDARAEAGFAGFDPCGLPGVTMTSLATAGAAPEPTADGVAPVLAGALAQRLGFTAEPCSHDDVLLLSAVAAPPAEAHAVDGRQPAS